MLRELEHLGFVLDVDFRLSEDRGGVYLEWLSAARQPTAQEIEAAAPGALAAAQAEELEKQQQQAGIVEAKRAYARMQAIIDGVDTATIAQLRLAVKEIARDIQHLIHAAVK